MADPREVTRWFDKYRDKMGRDRHLTFELLFLIASGREVRTIVETGCIRNPEMNWSGDGCSTIMFADYASMRGADFYVVDIDLTALKLAEGLTHHFPGKRFFTAMDSTQYLKDFQWENGGTDNKIDILYLDAANDSEMQIAEFQAAEDKLHEDSLILLDDKDTKGLKSIQYINSQGWSVHTMLYQVLFIKRIAAWTRFIPETTTFRYLENRGVGPK